MAAQTWDIQLVAQIVSTGVGNTTSTSEGTANVVAQVQLKPPYSLVFDVTASPTIVGIAAASQATVVDVPGATALTFTGPLAGTTVEIVSPTTTG